MKSDRLTCRLLLLAATALLATANGAAQERPVLQDLHVSGSTAFTLDRSTSGAAGGSGFSGSAYGGEFNSQFQGAVLDPRFVDFGTNFSYGHSANYYFDGSSGANLLSGGANVRFLPAGNYPLSFYYQRDTSGAGPQGFNSNMDTSNLGLDWMLNPPHMPHFEFQMNRNSSTNNVFTSIGDHNAAANSYTLTVHDVFKGWNWSVSGNQNDSYSWAEFFGSPVQLDARGRGVGASVGRMFWGGKGSFNYNFDRTHTNQDNADLGNTRVDFTDHQAAMLLRPTDRLTTSLTYQNYSNVTDSVVAATTPGDFVFLPTLSFTTQSIVDETMYRLTQHITVVNGLRYSWSDNPATTYETSDTWFSETPGVMANYSWRRIQFSGRYGLQFDTIGTSFSRSFSSVSQAGNVGASWGDTRFLQLTSTFSVSHNLVPELEGAYVDTKQFGVSGETSRFQNIARIRFRVDHVWMDSLSNPGLVNNSRTGWSVSLIRRRIQGDFGITDQSGVRQAFATPAQIFQPLPISTLIGVPLLDGVTHDRFVHVSAQLRPNLLAGVSYHNETNDLLTGSINYSALDFNANYRIGKMSVDFAYGRYLNTSQLFVNAFQSTSNLNRIRLRIARSFNLF